MTGDLARALSTFNALAASATTSPASLQAVCNSLQPALATLLTTAAPLDGTEKDRYLKLLQSLSAVLNFIKLNFPSS
jgi:hypothetical protein